MPLPEKQTSRKLNLLKAARFDRTVSDFDNRVLAALADHMDNRKGYTWPVADETIALEIGCKWPRSVIRARFRLRDSGYLTWQRTRTSNVYSFNFAKAATALDMLAAVKKNGLRTDSRRTAGLTRESAIPNASDASGSDSENVSEDSNGQRG